MPSTNVYEYTRNVPTTFTIRDEPLDVDVVVYIMKQHFVPTNDVKGSIETNNFVKISNLPKGTKTIDVVYEMKPSGRFFAKGVAHHKIPRIARFPSIPKGSHDIDMENSKFNILNSLIEYDTSSEVPNHKYLNSYVKKRQSWLDLVPTVFPSFEGSPKQFFVILYNAGFLNGLPPSEHPELQRFVEMQDECNRIYAYLVHMIQSNNPDEYESMLDYLNQSGHNVDDIIVNKLNALICDIFLKKCESEIIYNAIHYLKSKGYKPFGYSFDGFLLHFTEDIEAIIKDLNDWIFNETPYKVNFINKPYDQDMIYSNIQPPKECVEEETEDTHRGESKKTLQMKDTIEFLRSISKETITKLADGNLFVYLTLDIIKYAEVVKHQSNGTVSYSFNKNASEITLAIRNYMRQMQIKPLDPVGKVCYMFNPDTLLWENFSNDTSLQCRITDSIIQHTKQLQHILQSMAENDLTEFFDYCIDTFNCKGVRVRMLNEYFCASIGELYIEDSTFFTQLNTHPYYYPFKSFNVDLRTGKRKERKAEHYFSVCEDYDYDPSVDTTEYIDILRKITCGNDSDLQSIQTYIGYSLYGDTSKQVGLFLTGAGSNGKSALTASIQEAFGCFTRNLPNDFLLKGADMNKELQKHSIDKPRILLCNEIAKKNLDTERFKTIIDGGKMNTKVLYGENREFVSRGHITVTANIIPVFQQDGHGQSMSRRGLKLSCDATFVDEPHMVNEAQHKYLKDANLFANFKKEALKLQIAKFFIEGASMYHKTGIHNSYSLNKRWKTDVCDANDSKLNLEKWLIVNTYKQRDAMLSKKELLDHVKDEITINEKDFLKYMKELGYEYNRGIQVNNIRGCFVGIALSDDKLIRNESEVEEKDELD